MTETDNIGTTLERRRRRQYWALMVGALLVSLAIGMTGRISTGPEGTISPVLAIVLVVALTALLLVGTWVYFRKVDELEWANNLFGCFWGFNAFVLAFPAWEILHKGRLAPEPDTMIIYMGAVTVALLAYCWKRFR